MRQTVHGTAFPHAVYFKPGNTASRTLHVYLDGDGSPWTRGRWVATDPTPSDPLTLHLMGVDASPAVYVGRPCYHGLLVPACDPSLWTNARYSETVVASMSAAIARLSTRYGTGDLVLLGYSGGGTLAMLVAQRLEAARAVVTVAANLDVDAWTRLHGYLPLTGSLKLLGSESLREDIVQLHYAGAQDQNVPAPVVTAVAGTQRNSTVTVIPGFDHRCCWLEQWPEILARLDRLIAPDVPGSAPCPPHEGKPAPLRGVSGHVRRRHATASRDILPPVDGRLAENHDASRDFPVFRTCPE